MHIYINIYIYIYIYIYKVTASEKEGRLGEDGGGVPLPIARVLLHKEHPGVISLPKNHRQHRTLHIRKDVLPYPLC